MNNFVISTCSFLDSFADKCDTSLSKLRDRITELEILTVVLEAKLNSIPELDGSGSSESVSRPAPPASAPSVDSQAPPPAPPSAPGAPQNAPPPPPAPAAAEQSMVVVPVPEADSGDSSTIAISKHPTYRKYFKMVEMGIPEAAAKIKMTNDGLNPDLLDTPDLRIPNDVSEE